MPLAISSFGFRPGWSSVRACGDLEQELPHDHGGRVRLVQGAELLAEQGAVERDRIERPATGAAARVLRHVVGVELERVEPQVGPLAAR